MNRLETTWEDLPKNEDVDLTDLRNSLIRVQAGVNQYQEYWDKRNDPSAGYYEALSKLLTKAIKICDEGTI